MITLASNATSSISSISGWDLLNLFAAAISIVLAVVALALSIFFFVQSKNAARESSQSASEISSSVSRLEKLFDSLYSDTFAMMRETVTDMRRHVWKAAPEPVTADKSEKAPKADHSDSVSTEAEFMTQLDKVSRAIGITDAKVADLRQQLEPIIKQTLDDQDRRSREWQYTSHRVLRSRILQELKERPRTYPWLMRILNADEGDVVGILFDLARAGRLKWEGAPETLSPYALISYVRPDPRPSPRGGGSNGPS